AGAELDRRRRRRHGAYVAARAEPRAVQAAAADGRGVGAGRCGVAARAGAAAQSGAVAEGGLAMRDLFELDGRVAFISGAAGYLRQAMTGGLLSAGAGVILNGRNEARLSAFRAALADEGFSRTSIACFDVSDTAALTAFFKAQRQLDILINNAITVSMGTI